MWKDIPNWDLYEINENGDIRNKKTQKLIIGFINNAGYSRVCPIMGLNRSFIDIDL